MARTVSIGEQYFEDLISNGCFYVDKTDFIKEWWESRDKVTLITRPRRFGKTLTLSMLESFFSIKYSGRGDLFEGLSIWKSEKYRRIQGAYPVISLSFGNVKENNYEQTCREICRLVTREYRKHAFLLESSCLLSAEKDEYLHMITDGFRMEDVNTSINQLSEYLSRYYRKKVIILLDEYDTPMHEAYVNGYWDKLTVFARAFFNSTFKTNPYLERGLMTGITRIAKESIFSDLNNLEVISTTSGKYETSFGFTEEEVFCALEEFGLQGEMQKVKEWYDGFKFGEHDSIYNPWSITNLMDKKKFKNYWVNSSSNKLVSDLIQKGNKSIKIVMEDLLLGKPFCTSMDEEVVFNQLDNHPDAVWGLLLASGYLKAVSSVLDLRGKMDYLLAITNLEVKNMFEDMFIGWFSNRELDLGFFSDALLADDIDSMNQYLNEVRV